MADASEALADVLEALNRAFKTHKASGDDPSVHIASAASFYPPRPRLCVIVPNHLTLVCIRCFPDRSLTGVGVGAAGWGIVDFKLIRPPLCRGYGM